MSRAPTITEHWCLGLDAGRDQGVCLHCETCAHLWRGQPGGALLHPPGRIVLMADGRASSPRLVECGLRSAIDQQVSSVAPLSRQVRDSSATWVTARDAGPGELGGQAM